MAIKTTLMSWALVLACALPAFSSDLIIQPSVLYPYQSTITLQDDFISGSTGSGTIGALGFGFGGGTTTTIAAETNRNGILRRDTGAVINTIGTLILNPNTSSLFQATLPHRVLWIERLNTNDANTEIRIGAANPINTNPPTDGEYFEKLAADTNYFCVTRSAGAQTRTDTGVAVNTVFNNFLLGRISGSVQFMLNNVTVCTHTTNLPSVSMNPFTQIINTAAAAKTHDHDYFELTITGLTR